MIIIIASTIIHVLSGAGVVVSDVVSSTGGCSVIGGVVVGAANPRVSNFRFALSPAVIDVNVILKSFLPSSSASTSLDCPTRSVTVLGVEETMTFTLVFVMSATVMTWVAVPMTKLYLSPSSAVVSS